MNRFSLLLLAGLVVLPTAATAGNARFADKTAHVLPEGAWEVGLFAPLRWGVTEELTLSAHPVLEALLPHLEAQYGLDKTLGLPDGHAFAIQGALTAPSIFVHTLARSGVGGLYAPEPPEGAFAAGDDPAALTDWTVMPFALGLSAHGLYSIDLSGHLLTGHLGFRSAATFGKKRLVPIDHFFGYARTASYVTGITADLGVAVDGPIAGDFYYRADIRLDLMPGLDGLWMLEHSGRVRWRATDGFQVMLGYYWYVGAMTYGVRASPPFPGADLVWSW